jgi:RNA polymerase sigma factor (sigma-70 family)
VLARIIQNELTEKQRHTFLAYHIQKKTIPQIAAEQGVFKSTVSRTLKRAEQKIGRITQYL